jgi:hypothetical protein
MTTTRQESTMNITTRPDVLAADTVYAAYDRYLCRDCAGYTAQTTGRGIDGHRLVKVSAAEIREWVALGMGALTCECGRVTVA